MRKMIAAAAAALMMWGAAAVAQGISGSPTVPLWYCQLSATQLESAVGLSKCVSASFTGSAGAGALANQLTTSSVTGQIAPGQAVTGTGVTAGTTVVSQISGTPGGAGVYLLSANSTASSASLTSGGVPAGQGVTMTMQAETANVRWRDDGAAPTSAIGMLLVSGDLPQFYPGALGGIGQMQLIAATGSPLVDVTFYRAQGSP